MCYKCGESYNTARIKHARLIVTGINQLKPSKQPEPGSGSKGETERCLVKRSAVINTLLQTQ